MDAATFFARLNALMKDNPPAAGRCRRDEAVRGDRGRAGQAVRPGEARPGGGQGGRTGCPCRTRARSSPRPRSRRETRSTTGRSPIDKIGRYGTDYLFRSIVARIGLGSNLPEDGIYPFTRVDAEGKALTGANRYVIRFPKGQLPPVGAFWSVTMYNSKQAFVDNPINRYAIGDRDKLKFDDDGSLTLYVQHESPGKDKESNWLPAPKDEFNLIMRLYSPKKEILDGTWKPPAVERVK